MTNYRKEFIIWGLKGFIFCLCVILVTILTFLNFLEFKKGTLVSKISLEPNTKYFPTLTICPNYQSNWPFSHNYKKDELETCNITSINDYIEGNFAGDCSDPKLLHESALYSSLELMATDALWLPKHNEDCDECDFANDQNVLLQTVAAFETVDHPEYGRCYSMSPDSKMRERQIQRFNMGFPSQPRLIVYIGDKDRFLTETQRGFLMQKVKPIDPAAFMQIHFSYEKHITVNTEKMPCEEDKDYSMDKCILDKIHQDSMEQFGCTTPFGIDKTQICKEKEMGTKALKLFRSYTKKAEEHCLKPCRAMQVNAVKIQHLKINFPENQLEILNSDTVKVTETRRLSSILDLLANFGGFLAIFLGVSIFTIFNYFITLFAS